MMNLKSVFIYPNNFKFFPWKKEGSGNLSENWFVWSFTQWLDYTYGAFERGWMRQTICTLLRFQ